MKRIMIIIYPFKYSFNVVWSEFSFLFPSREKKRRAVCCLFCWQNYCYLRIAFCRIIDVCANTQNNYNIKRWARRECAVICIFCIQFDLLLLRIRWLKNRERIERWHFLALVSLPCIAIPLRNPHTETADIVIFSLSFSLCLFLFASLSVVRSILFVFSPRIKSFSLSFGCAVFCDELLRYYYYRE